MPSAYRLLAALASIKLDGFVKSQNLDGKVKSSSGRRTIPEEWEVLGSTPQ
jgi:hypothetical protein